MIPDKKEITEWLAINELKPEEVEVKVKEAEYGFKIERAGIRLDVIRIKKRNLFRVQAVFTVGTNHIERFSHEKQQEFIRQLLQMCAILRVDYNLIENGRFGIYNLLFDDAFNFNNLNDSIKRVTLAVINNLQTLNFILGLDGGEEESEGTDSSFPNYYG